MVALNIKSIFNKPLHPLFMLMATVGNFLYIGFLLLNMMHIVLNAQTSLKDGARGAIHFCWDQYYIVGCLVLVMMTGWLVYCRFPRIGALIEAIPTILVGMLAIYFTLEYVM